MTNKNKYSKHQIPSTKLRPDAKRKKIWNLEFGIWNLSRVMVFGTFDIFHPGHKNFLKQAKKYGNYLIAVIARDRTVKEVKGKLPKNPENVRLKNVVSSGLADKVILGNLSDKYAVIRKHKPGVIALGYDQFNYTDGLIKKFLNIKVIRLKPFKPSIYKSSKIRRQITDSRQ